MANSPTWSVYDGEWGSDEADAVDMPLVTRPADTFSLKGSHLKKKTLLKRGAQGAVYSALDSSSSCTGGAVREVAVKRLFTQSNDFGAHGVAETVLREATILQLVGNRQAQALSRSDEEEDEGSRAAGDNYVDNSARVIELYRIVEAPHRELCLVMELCALDLVQAVFKARQPGLGVVVSRDNNHGGGDDAAAGSNSQLRGNMAVIRYLLRRILRMIAFLHETCGVIHRDLKLSNILVTSDGALRLSDFGSSRLMHTQKQPAVGGPSNDGGAYTPASLRTTMIYQAPECLLGNCHYTTAVDVWSAGIMFAELLRQSHLFSSSSELGLVSAIWKLLGAPEVSPANTTVRVNTTTRTASGGGSGEEEEEVQATLPNKFPLSIVSAEGYDLLKRMLSIDPNARPTVAECLAHPFLVFPGDAKEDAEGQVQWAEHVRGVIASRDKPVRVRMMALGVGSDSEDDEDDEEDGCRIDIGPFSFGV